MAKTKTREEPQAKTSSQRRECAFFCLSSSCPIYRLQPVHINASPLTTDRNITASSFSMLLLPALLTAIHLSAWCLTYMADRLGNQVDMTILSTPEAHPAELASFGFVL